MDSITYEPGMNAMSCTSCLCIIRAGEQVVMYSQRAGTDTHQRAYHADYTLCQAALASEAVRYSRLPHSSGDGVRRYVNANIEHWK